MSGTPPVLDMQVRPEMTYGIYVIESFILMQIYNVWCVRPASKHHCTGGCMIRLVQAVHLWHPKHTTSCTVQGHRLSCLLCQALARPAWHLILKSVCMNSPVVTSKSVHSCMIPVLPCASVSFWLLRCCIWVIKMFVWLQDSATRNAWYLYYHARLSLSDSYAAAYGSLRCLCDCKTVQDAMHDTCTTMRVCLFLTRTLLHMGRTAALLDMRSSHGRANHML